MEIATQQAPEPAQVKRSKRQFSTSFHLHLLQQARMHSMQVTFILFITFQLALLLGTVIEYQVLRTETARWHYWRSVSILISLIAALICVLFVLYALLTHRRSSARPSSPAHESIELVTPARQIGASLRIATPPPAHSSSIRVAPPTISGLPSPLASNPVNRAEIWSPKAVQKAASTYTLRVPSPVIFPGASKRNAVGSRSGSPVPRRARPRALTRIQLWALDVELDSGQDEEL